MEEIKLDPEFKAKFVAALRSGDYKQGKSLLYNSMDDCYCFMGVAGVLLGIPADSLDGNYCPDASLGYPKNLRFGNIGIDRAVYMNDTGKSFIEIADYIEQNL